MVVVVVLVVVAVVLFVVVVGRRGRRRSRSLLRVGIAFLFAPHLQIADVAIKVIGRLLVRSMPTNVHCCF